MNEKNNIKRDEDFDLFDIFHVIWSEKWLISSICAFAAIISLAVALSLPNIYVSSALLAPAEQSDGNLNRIRQQYGGLASLAGVALPMGGQASKAKLGIELMKSRAFIGDFVERRNLLPELMAANSWNLKTGKLSYDTDLYNPETGQWIRKVSHPLKPIPSKIEAHRAFLEILTVFQNRETGYLQVSIEHISPVIAAKWVNWLVEDLNNAVKQQDIEEATKSIEYLKQQILSTNIAQLQAVFFELIQAQTETAMLAEVRPEYVFETIDPAIIPEQKFRPKRAQLCILGTFLGGFLGIIFVLIRHYLPISKKEIIN